MNHYEYRVVPAPNRAEKYRGARTTEERFALTVATAMNDLGRDGWEYLRADTLPCEERAGLTGRTTNYHVLLVFRRPILPQAALHPVAHGIAVQRPDDGPRLGPAESPERLEGAVPRLGPATD